MTDFPLVLVVEDDPGISMFATDVLENHGSAVISVSSADEGLVVLQQRHDIDVVLVDVFTPGTLDGLALVSEIRRRWPNKEIVITSGFLPAEAACCDGAVFLPKPYDESRLLAALDQAHTSHA